MRFPRLLLSSGALLLGACAQGVRPELESGPGCPLSPGTHGYPVTVASTDPSVTQAQLSSIARAVAAHWRAPGTTVPRLSPTPVSPTPDLLASIALQDTAPGFWRHGWVPGPADTGTIVMVFHRVGGAPGASFGTPGPAANIAPDVQAAATRAWDATIAGWPQRDTMPLSVGAHDSAAVYISFGREPDPGDGVARFTAQERMSLPRTGTTGPHYPSALRDKHINGEVLASFIIGADGEVQVSSIRVISSADPGFAAAVRQHLPTMHFIPAERDCVPVPQLVAMPFHFEVR